MVTEDGLVTGVVELAWPDDRVAIMLAEQRKPAVALEGEGWRVFAVDDIPEDLTRCELFPLLSHMDEV